MVTVHITGVLHSARLFTLRPCHFVPTLFTQYPADPTLNQHSAANHFKEEGSWMGRKQTLSCETLAHVGLMLGQHWGVESWLGDAVIYRGEHPKAHPVP